MALLILPAGTARFFFGLCVRLCKNPKKHWYNFARMCYGDF